MLLIAVQVQTGSNGWMQLTILFFSLVFKLTSWIKWDKSAREPERLLPTRLVLLLEGRLSVKKNMNF